MSLLLEPDPVADDPIQERIIRAATELFAIRGYQGATTDDIAERAAITKRTLYRRMGEKEAILYEIQQRVVGELYESVFDIDPTQPRLPQYISAHVRIVSESQLAMQILFEEMKHLSPMHRAEIIRARHRYWQKMPVGLQQDQAVGLVREVDVQLAVHGSIGAVNSTYRWPRPPSGPSSAQIESAATDLFMNGLLADRTGTKTPTETSPYMYGRPAGHS
jgi:AcrR family transcriptional regulator